MEYSYGTLEELEALEKAEKAKIKNELSWYWRAIRKGEMSPGFWCFGFIYVPADWEPEE